MGEQAMYELEGWPGGLNRSVDITALDEKELYEAVNVVIDSRGDVARRSGYQLAQAGGSSQLTTIGSWWPNGSSKEVLVGLAASDSDIEVVRSQGNNPPYALDVVSAGSAVGSYALPTIDFFYADYASLASDDLYVVTRRSTDPVYKLVWVDDFTAPTASALTEATFAMLEPEVPSERGDLVINATGGTFECGSALDTITCDYGITAADLQTKLRSLIAFSNTLTVESPSANTYTIRLSAIDPTIVTDGSNLTGGAGTAVYTKTSSQDEPADQFPSARFALAKHSRMWAAHVEAGGYTYASRLYYSDLLKPEKWYSGQYFDFTPADGQEITAMVPYGEAIMVFKNASVSLLTGKSEDSFAVTVLDENIGTVSPKSVASVGALLMFFDRDHGVIRFDGAQFMDVSEQIRDYLLDGINHEYAFTAAAFLRRNVYYLSVPWGSSKVPNRTFVYDVAGNLWYEWDFGFNQAALMRGDVFAAVNGEVVFCRLFDGDDDNGSAIAAYLETGWLSPATGGAIHRIRRLDASFADEGTSQQVKLTSYTDYSDTLAHEETVTPDGTGRFQRIGGFGQERWHQLKVRLDNVSGSDFRLNKLLMRLNIARRGRGVDSPNG